MPTDRILVIGSGGHAKVVIDALRALGCADTRLIVIDDDAARQGDAILGLTVRAPLAEYLVSGGWFHVAVGDNAARSRAAESCRAAGMRPYSVVHPSARISPAARLAPGSFVAAGAVIGPDAALEADCIVNHNAVVDHDCRVGAACHVAPSATLAGAVTLGARVLVGAGANVLPGRRVADDCIVGAGAVVTKDFSPGTVIVGVPARSLPRIRR